MTISITMDTVSDESEGAGWDAWFRAVLSCLETFSASGESPFFDGL